ncbi:uncharacterized protein LOC142560597 isoform X1 [Dermacentor variabilis]|uniref:uncharacterized protein LOC142560597 isoform X1 n=1 Tax=Dermacentor variabilis TaxID=34621 RepID=UPI003F5B740E
MNHKDVPKMSVTAQFDDFCRRFAGDDDEVLSTMLDFVRNQEVCRQRWEAAEKCCNRLAKDNESLVLVNSELQAKLRYTRDVLEKEVQRKLKCEARLEALQAQLDQVRYCIFGQSFENREHHMVRILKNVLSQDNFVSTVADKSVQSVLSPTSTTFSSLAHHSEDLASREVSGDTRHMLLGMQATQSPLPLAGTRHLSSGQALSGAVPSGSVSFRPVSIGPLYSGATAASVPTRPALPVTVPVVQVPSGAIPSEAVASGAASSGVSSGPVAPGPALPISSPVVPVASKATPSEANSSGAVFPAAVSSGSVTPGPALSGPVPIVPDPSIAISSGAPTSEAVSSGVVSSGLVTNGPASHGSVPMAPVTSRVTSSGHGTPGSLSFKLVPPRAAPTYSLSPGHALSSSVPVESVTSKAVSSAAHVHATPALHAGYVNARSVYTGSARARFVSNGSTPAGSVPLPWGPAGPASTGPDPCGSVPSRPGPTPSKHTAAERCSSGLGPAPAKVHFELSGSQKTSTCSGSHETGGRGEVFATTMTVVAGEPGYVATVTSQMEGSISSSNSSHQRFRRSRSGPALLVQHSQKAKEKVASVPRSNPVLEESGLEEESGFVSRLERLGPQKSSTPVPDTFQQQQPHTFISRPAVNPENCTACDKRIRFYKASFQCGACGIVCHPECRSLVPLPCGLRAPPPEAGGASHSTAAKSSPGFLTDYAPSEPPFVPPLVVHCIHEVERRCLQERGRLYGSAAPPEEVDTLLGRLLSGRDVPVLSGHSLPVVCGALMKFLAALRETVITKSVWPLLAEAAVTGDEDKENRAWRLLDATRRLPAANRAVLAKLLVHLRSVSATSLGGDGRSLDELATVFAPVVVGCSENNPPTEVQERDRPLRDLIMHCLLGVSDVYWTDNAAPASSDPNETVQQETRPGTTAGDCCTGGWKEAIKSKLRRSIGVGSLDTGNRK